MSTSIHNFYGLLNKVIIEFSDDDGRLILLPDTATELFKKFLVELKNGGYCDGISRDNWSDIIKFNIFQNAENKATIVGAIRTHPDKAVLAVQSLNKDIEKDYKYFVAIDVPVCRSVVEVLPKKEQESQDTPAETTAVSVQDELVDTLLMFQERIAKVISATKEDIYDFINLSNNIQEIYSKRPYKSDSDCCETTVKIHESSIVVNVSVYVETFHNYKPDLGIPDVFELVFNRSLCKK